MSCLNRPQVGSSFCFSFVPLAKIKESLHGPILIRHISMSSALVATAPAPKTKSRAKKKRLPEDGVISPNTKKAKLASRIDNPSSDEEGGSRPVAGPSSRPAVGAPRTQPPAAAAAALARSAASTLTAETSAAASTSSASSSKTKATKQPKSYVPEKQSGGYAILLALGTNASDDDPTNDMTKGEIIELAEAKGWCKTPFTTTERGKLYTAWNRYVAGASQWSRGGSVCCPD